MKITVQVGHSSWISKNRKKIRFISVFLWIILEMRWALLIDVLIYCFKYYIYYYFCYFGRIYSWWITWGLLPWILRNLLHHFYLCHISRIFIQDSSRLYFQLHCLQTGFSARHGRSNRYRLCPATWTSSSGSPSWKAPLSTEMKPGTQCSWSCRFCPHRLSPSVAWAPSFRTSCPRQRGQASAHQCWWSHHG